MNKSTHKLITNQEVINAYDRVDQNMLNMDDSEFKNVSTTDIIVTSSAITTFQQLHRLNTNNIGDIFDTDLCKNFIERMKKEMCHRSLRQ